MRTLPTPSSPGPTWAPSTAPISETKTGSQPKISRQSSTRVVGGLLVLDVLDDPAVGALLVALAGVVAQPLQRAGAGADPLDRGDLLLEGEDRLDLQGAADPGAGAADAAAAAQVLEGVDREPHLQRPCGSPRRVRGRPSASAPAAAAVAAPSAQRPIPPAAERESMTWMPLAALVFVDQPLAGLAGGLEGAGDAGRDVDRDDFPAGVEQRLVDGRGSRRSRAARWWRRSPRRAAARRSRRSRSMSDSRSWSPSTET